jgi:hypothetical protein
MADTESKRTGENNEEHTAGKQTSRELVEQGQGKPITDRIQEDVANTESR